jgi:hypothetical protein
MANDGLEGPFWFCVKHHRVETSEQIDSNERLGPFTDADTASRALEIVAEREKRYQAEDSAWDGDS